MATILFGGSFDPVHNGHVAMVKAAKAAMPKATLLVLPAACSPFKTQTTQTDFCHRVAMCKLAFSSEEVTVSELESTLPAPSYTVQTMTALQKARPDEYWFLCGADAFLSLPRWREAEKLMSMTSFLVVDRDERKAEISALAKELKDRGLRAKLIPMPPSPVSSTAVREAMKSRSSLAGLVPTAVENYINQYHLYGRVSP